MTIRRRNEANTPKVGWGAELIDDPQDEDLARNWWAIGLRGVIAIAFGTTALVLPATALFALVVVFAAYALVDGVFSVVAGVRRPDGGRSWLMILGGLAGVFVGIVAPFMPGMTVLLLVTIAAWWALITGAFQLAVAYGAKAGAAGRGILGIDGILSILLGGLLLFFPGLGAVALVLAMGAYALVSGVSLLLLAFRLRSRAQEVEESEAPIERRARRSTSSRGAPA
jgi:uncharacterized membrane protein HdeD (DUF308 family)